MTNGDSWYFSIGHTLSGPMSVCQGSTLSGLLYLVYMLDYPLLFNPRILTIEEYDQSKEPIVKIEYKEYKQLQNKNIKEVLDKITDYILQHPCNKSRKDEGDSNYRQSWHKRQYWDKNRRKDNPIKPIRSMVYLGITVQDNLKLNQFLTEGPANLVNKLRQKSMQ